MIKRIIKNLIHRSGYRLASLNEKPYVNVHTMDDGLARFAERGGQVSTVVDVGASDGRWSRDCMRHFPEASYLLIEAQAGHTAGLDATIGEHANAAYVLAAAGKTEGKVYFDDEELFAGVAIENPLDSKKLIEVKMTSIDKQVHERGLKAPFLIKLDTHGFEIPILEGAAKTIPQCSLIIIECYNYQITGESLKFHEMCRYMESLGFSVIDIADLMLREKDRTFWQMDIFFVPSDSPEFGYVKYK